MARLVLIAAASAALASCYGPSVPDCAYTCATDSDCPSVQRCDVTAGACRAPGAAGACGATAIDGGLSFVPSNYTAADLMGLPAIPLSVTGQQTIDTDMDTPSSTLLNVDGIAMRLFHVSDMMVSASAQLELTGSASAIFAVDGNAVIDGDVAVSAGAKACATQAGTVGGACTSGGAGGAFNGHGGDGGGCVSVPAALGSPSLMPDLVPLEGGCNGAASNNAIQGGGGAAGGAIEISAGKEIVIVGVLDASGGGGAGGIIMSGSFLVGGAGGGAGGGILLEAPSVMFTETATICASGGGGGGGSFNDSNNGVVEGSTGRPGCAPGGGSGGAGPTDSDGDGGSGGGDRSDNAGDGAPGDDGAGDAGGGGGGGAAGVIIVRTSGALDTANVAPLPKTPLL